MPIDVPLTNKGMRLHDHVALPEGTARLENFGAFLGFLSWQLFIIVLSLMSESIAMLFAL